MLLIYLAYFLCDIVRFLDLIKPFAPLLPEVASPETKTPFNQKLMWTGVSRNLASWATMGSEKEWNAEVRHLIVDPPYISGHEPNATIRHCLFGQLGPHVLAADDVSK